VHPLKQLKKLLKSTTPSQGKVLKVGNEIMVSTNKGMLSIQRSINDATTYHVGDAVILSNGIIVGKRQQSSTIYVI